MRSLLCVLVGVSVLYGCSERVRKYQEEAWRADNPDLQPFLRETKTNENGLTVFSLKNIYLRDQKRKKATLNLYVYFDDRTGQSEFVIQLISKGRRWDYFSCTHSYYELLRGRKGSLGAPVYRGKREPGSIIEQLFYSAPVYEQMLFSKPVVFLQEFSELTLLEICDARFAVDPRTRMNIRRFARSIFETIPSETNP